MRHTILLLQLFFMFGLSTSARAAYDPLSPGIYDEKTDENLQARCLTWEVGDQTKVCTAIQFTLTTKGQMNNIGNRFDTFKNGEFVSPNGAPYEKVPIENPVVENGNEFDGPFRITATLWTAETGSMLGLPIGACTVDLVGFSCIPVIERKIGPKPGAFLLSAPQSTDPNYQADLNTYNQALTKYDQRKTQYTKTRTNKLAEYCSAIVGGSLFVVAIPLFADFFRDAYIYPAYAFAKKHTARRNKKITLEWTQAWYALVGSKEQIATPVRDEIFQAMVKAITQAPESGDKK